MRCLIALMLLGSQAIGAPMTQAECKTTAAFATSLLGMSTPAVSVDSDGYCLTLDTAVFQGDAYDLVADRIRWQLKTTSPITLDLQVDDLRAVYSGLDVFEDYVRTVQAKREAVDIALKLEWDARAQLLYVETLALDFGPLGAVMASAKMADVDLLDFATIVQGVESWRWIDAEAEITMHGLFERYALKPLGQFVFNVGANPSQAMAVIKTTAVRAIQSVNTDLLPEGSADALSGFIEALPAPDGILRVSYDTPIEGGVAGADVAAFLWLRGNTDLLPEGQSFPEFTVNFEWDAPQ